MSPRRIIVFLNIVLSCIFALAAGSIIEFAPINPDAGAYLRAANYVSNGLVLYRDFSCGYTPFGIFTFAVIAWVSNREADYSIYLSMLVVVQLITAWILYKLLRIITKDPNLSTLGALALLFMTFYYEGTYIVLEPFVALLSLFSFYLLVRYPIQGVFFSGYCSGLAFLYKQFGLFIVPCLLLLTLRNSFNIETRIKRILIFIIGYTIPIILCFSALYIIGGVSPVDLLHTLSGGHYTGFSFDWKILARLTLLLAPVIVPLLWMVALPMPRCVFEILVAAFVALIASLLPLYFRTYPHYIILAAPFVVLIAFTGIWQLMQSSLKRNSLKLIYFAVMFSILVIYPICVTSLSFQFQKWQPRDQQRFLAKDLDDNIPHESSALVFADPSLCFLSKKLRDPILTTMGVGCGFYESVSALAMPGILDVAKVIVIDPKNHERFLALNERMTREGLDIQRYLNSNFSLIKSNNRRVQLWIRKNAVGKD